MKASRKIGIGTALVAATLCFGGAAQGADACSGFKWDVTREMRLFAMPGSALAPATTVADAPSIGSGQLYTLTLKPQESVQYAAPPTKRMLADGAYGGLLKLEVATAGTYRIAIDAGFWLDVVHAGKPLQSVDFNGSTECAGPRKIVVYELPAGAEFIVQLAAATGPAARLSVTPVVESPR